MRLGVQIAVGRGLPRAVKLAAERRCDCFQVHAGNPRGFRALVNDRRVRDLPIILEIPDEKQDVRNLRAIRRLIAAGRRRRRR